MKLKTHNRQQSIKDEQTRLQINTLTHHPDAEKRNTYNASKKERIEGNVRENSKLRAELIQKQNITDNI